MKILSVIVPAYNSEKFLDKGIPSFLSPEILDKLEIIIVNDGSTDATVRKAEPYCAQYPGSIRLISQENKGHGGALNTGFAAATGKYIKPIDADDWVETGNLPELIRRLECCESDVVLTHYHTVNISTGEIQDWMAPAEAFGKLLTLEEIMASWRSYWRSMTFHGMAYKRSFYLEKGIRLSQNVFFEDYEYATFPCCQAESLTALDLFVYDYRIGDVEQSVSDGSKLRRIGHLETVLRRMMAEASGLQLSSAGRSYAAMKTQELLLSYLTVSLLADPDRKQGRARAEKMVEAVRTGMPEAYALAEKKYRIFRLMNRLHITKAAWETLLKTKLYRTLRG